MLASRVAPGPCHGRTQLEVGVVGLPSQRPDASQPAIDQLTRLTRELPKTLNVSRCLPGPNDLHRRAGCDQRVPLILEPLCKTWGNFIQGRLRVQLTQLIQEQV